jgi:hypothetical protein
MYIKFSLGFRLLMERKKNHVDNHKLFISKREAEIFMGLNFQVSYNAVI